MFGNTREYLKNHKIQWALFLFAMCGCVVFLATLEDNLVNKLGITYSEYYQKPFALSLDPFLYTYLVNGIAEADPPQPDPRYLFSHEETILSSFVDYFIRTRVDYDSLDASIATNIDNTIRAMGSHLRGLLFYKLDQKSLRINPILQHEQNLRFGLNIPAKANKFGPNELTNVVSPNRNKLVWNVVPWCWDPVLEESLHELGNRNGFLFVRGHVRNYRFPEPEEADVIAMTLSSVPIKTAYIHEHRFINFTNLGYRPPLYVSLTCDPIKRKLRHFFTDRRNFREYSGTAKIGTTSDSWWNMTLEECMTTQVDECKYWGVESDKNQRAVTWLPRRVDWVIPQFCESCTVLGKASNLEEAVTTVESRYAVVGTLEKIGETLDVLEAKVPEFFKGIKRIYQEKLSKAAGTEEPEHEVSPQIHEEMKRRFAAEIQFYDFVTQRLDSIHKNL